VVTDLEHRRGIAEAI